MHPDLIVAILICIAAGAFGFLVTRRKKVGFPPIVTGTISTPPEPTPEETGPPVNTNDESVVPEVTPVPHRAGSVGVDTTPTQVDVNNEQLG